MNPEKLDELIALIYETPVQPEAWQVFMETLVRGFDADGGDFVSEHLLQGTLAVYGTAGFDPYYRELYEENIRRSNVWVRAIHSDRVQDVSQSECGLISTPALLSTEFFNEWLKPQRLRYSIAGVVAKDPQTVTFVGLMRQAGRPAFASPDEKTLRLLIRHIRRATRLGQLMGEERARTRDALSVLDHYHNPCFLIGQSGSVEHRNLAAARFLEEETELYVTADRRLRARSGGNDSRLRDAIENARDVTVDASSGVPSIVRIRRESARDLAVLVFPVRAAYQPMETATWSTIVLIMDPQSRVEDTGTVLTQYFGLTPKERKLALHLLDGRSLESFAEEEAIGIGTARWHLKNLLSKTQTSRQGEMVALLMRLFTPR